jgi:hypothetical protein
MMSINPVSLSRWLLRAGPLVVLLATVGWAWPPPTASVTVPPVPRGAARVWFYRDLDVSESLSRPYIRMNDAIIGISEPGGAFYRDVAPGFYHVAADSYGRDFNQTRDVTLLPGQEVYFKVLSLRNWISGGGANKNGYGYGRDTFYVWLMPAELARGDVDRAPFFGGN